MIVDNGFKIAINRIGKASPDYVFVNQFKVGTLQATVNATDTDLTIPVPIFGTETVDDCTDTTNWVSGTDGTIATTTNVFKIGTTALTLIKNAQTVDNVSWYNQALATLDFTNKDLWGWVYIADQATLDKLATTDALEVRYGNDWNTNFYYYRYDKADLAVGWNIIKFNTTTATETGTVTLNACDSLAVKLTFTATTDEIAADAVVIDDFKLASSDDYFKDVLGDAPDVNEATYEISTSSFVNSVEANGYFLSGVGNFNKDTTPLAQDIFKFTPIEKSNSVEVIVEIKNRLVRR